jgi:hypothetical protein
MAAKNDVTGDRIASKANSQAYRDGMDRIFGKKPRSKAMDAMAEAMDAVAGIDEGTQDLIESRGSCAEPDTMRPLKG